MVFRSVWQRLLDRAQPETVEAGPQAGPNDEGLRAQAIQTAEQTRNLIAIETARGETRLRLVTRIGVLALAALTVLVCAALFVVNAAGHLHLPWSRIGTAVGTFLVAAATTGLSWWVKRALGRRAAGRASGANRPANRAEDDQDPARAP
ncbi:hypothetical protein ACIQU5_34340 [Streptomyces sp. NPDC090306]|uniref:hypothetical protein n=1 Tax=unclassified Streptomyces TaxID=2593676 RepID=UPI0036ED3F6C